MNKRLSLVLSGEKLHKNIVKVLSYSGLLNAQTSFLDNSDNHTA